MPDRVQAGSRVQAAAPDGFDKRARIEELMAQGQPFNIAAQIAMCRLHYRRIPKPLPSSAKGQAKYWKKYYNSSAGRGTVEDFLERVA